jgi:hypothetical protein
MIPRDPRLRLSAVIMSLQLLGQTVLGFNVSIAQIAVAILAGALLDAAIAYRRERALSWPTSGILTGSGVALILRVAGTRHGDWWSLDGAELFAAAAAIGILSKYLIRPRGRHVFNPSNLGLVLVLLFAGSHRVYPQYLWWGPMGPAVGLAWAVIIAGALWVLRPLRMWGMVAAFYLPFEAIVLVLAAQGSCFDAVWRADSVCGLNYWIGIAASPEVAVFVLFMMSDPRTAPAFPVGRAAYGTVTALVAWPLLAWQPTEYGVKVAILAALTMSCALVPYIEGILEHYGPPRPRPVPRRTAPWQVLVAAALVIVVPLGVLSLGINRDLIRSERGSARGGGGLRQ